MPEAITLPLFAQIRNQYSKLITKFMYELNYLPPSITYNVAKSEKINRSRSVDHSSSLSRDVVISNNTSSTTFSKEYLYSRYSQEFVELDLLGNI
jgi:hypothetical protein